MLAVLMGLAAVSCQKEETDDKVYHVLDANGRLTQKETYHLGVDISTPAGYYYADYIEIDPFVLAHSFGAWGFGEGFTYTNCSNDSTPGYTNLSAITAGGVEGDTYFIANTGGFDTPAEISFQDGQAYNAVECYVTNSTYAYLAMKNGDDGFGGVKTDWGAKDWFKLTITGYNAESETGTVEFLLASGTDIVSTWKKVDLTGLGRVSRLVFTLSSTDNGDWGMNTPSYFCLDRLKVSE